MEKKNQRFLLAATLIMCIGAIVAGGVHYVSFLRDNLVEQAVHNVLTVTRQQQQAFDNYIAADRERLRSYADYFSKHEDSGADAAKEMLTLFDDVKAVYAVSCLDSEEENGAWVATSNADYDYQYLDDETLETYRSFENSGVRSSYISIFSKIPMFGYYEKFTFPNGHTGVFQLSYETEKFSEAFSLSFYNGQGLNYVVNQEGDILLRSAGMLGDHLYTNIFEIINGTRVNQADVDRFSAALSNREPGTLTYEGERGTYVYAYVPMEAVDDWFLVSVVNQNAITEETNRILLNSQVMLALLIVILMVCAIVILLIWRTHRDIAQKEREIQYQEELFNIFSTHLSSSTDDVYILVDPKREKPEYVSPNVERVMGVSPESISGNIRSYTGTGTGKKKLDMDEIYAMKPGDSVEPILTGLTNPRTGKQQWFQVSVYCTAVQGEKRLVLYISDRTQERETQNSLSEALKMAQAANQAKSAFLSSVSHDIRTPMNAIIGFLTLMRDEVDKPDVVLEYTERIDAASQHLLSLINDVLDMNKIESGSATLNLTEMNMAEVIDEINTIIRPQAKAKDQNFEIYVSPLTYEHVQGDKLRINQILINLLSNSVKYTPAGGGIQMRVEELPQVVDKYSRLRFTICDNGMGMSEEYLKVIFEPFTREETKATYGIQGTGLGMAITKSLVDLMGGTIQVESRLGEGSTFTVELELYIQEQEHDPKFWSRHKITRMIVTDDEDEVCLNVIKSLEGTGVQVDCSTDGETAVRMMQAAQEEGKAYDLILLDWKMPGLNGLETTRLIREKLSEKIPIVILTSYDWGEIEQEAREVGVDHFMPKPFFISTFKETIRRVMGSQKKSGAFEDKVVEGKRILVVDDIEVNRIILVKILGTLGAECDTAGNGQEALEAFESSEPGKYDIILMDVQMPVMDGYSATRAIRASKHPEAKSIPIIAMTANAFVDDVRDAIESGMDAHIAKPVQIENLKSTIRQVLDSREQQGTE